MKRVAIAALVVLMACGSSPAFAQNGGASIKKSVAELAASELLAADQARPNAPTASSENKYFWPAVILMSAGGIVTLVGLTHETGISCTDTARSFSCGTTKSKGTIFAGLGMVGTGAFLYARGKSHPDLVFGPRLVGVRQQLSW